MNALIWADDGCCLLCKNDGPTILIGGREGIGIECSCLADILRTIPEYYHYKQKGLNQKVRELTRDIDEMTRRRTIARKTRFSVLIRDSHTCVYCGRKPPEVSLAIDHVVPVSKGGSNDISNLVTSCVDCNAGKSDR